jgi:hypothetical protein
MKNATMRPNHETANPDILRHLADTLISAGHHPFDLGGYRWALRWAGIEAARDPLRFCDALITEMLAVYDSRAIPFRGESLPICFSACSLPNEGCSHDFGNGATVRHVGLGEWAVDGTVYHSRRDAERRARRIAALAQLARDLGLAKGTGSERVR